MHDHFTRLNSFVHWSPWLVEKTNLMRWEKTTLVGARPFLNTNAQI
uniref:Uncharacterized protein n=1 Tax=Arundo donax TaxID=35708 RepID=A0A0A8YVE2_ARUDO